MGPSVERELWQTYMANQCQVLGLDVYNGSSSQLSGYQRTTRVSFIFWTVTRATFCGHSSIPTRLPETFSVSGSEREKSLWVLPRGILTVLVSLT